MKSWGKTSRSCAPMVGLAVACLLVFAFVTSGQAAVINFTGAPYNSWTSGPRSYTTGLGGGTMNVSAYDGNKRANLGYKTETRDGATAAGIGVWGGPAGGEIDPGESLLFRFNGGVDLTSFTTNFQYREYTNQPEDDQFKEWGKYRIHDGVAWGNWTYFSQNDDMQTYPNPFTPGAVTVAFGSGAKAFKLQITSSGCRDHDFTIAQLTTAGGGGSATPEPASMLLLASALGGFGFFRMRRKGSQT